MFESISKWGAGLAGLCLLCCAAPLALAFLGGGGLAAAELLEGQPGLPMEMGLFAGLLVMGLAAWAILRRRRRVGAACDVK